jgi:hypothetical protein
MGDWRTSAARTRSADEGTAYEAIARLRAAGWAVAVHNDYQQNGKPHTFWLFTKGNRCAKGEGRSDAEALEAATAAVDANHTPMTDEEEAAARALVHSMRRPEEWVPPPWRTRAFLARLLVVLDQERSSNAMLLAEIDRERAARLSAENELRDVERAFDKFRERS